MLKLTTSFFALLAATSLISCGSNDSSSRKGKGGVAAPFGGAENQRVEKFSYKIESVTSTGTPCTTEKAYDSQDAYCKGLQDVTLNGDCGSSTLYSLFQSDCQGYTWAPHKTSPQVTAQPLDQPAVQIPAPDYAYPTRSELPNFIVLKEINKNLNTFNSSNSARLNFLAEELASCGIKNFAPACLDGEFVPTSYPVSVTANGKQYLVSTISNRLQNAIFLAAFEFQSVQNKATQFTSNIEIVMVGHEETREQYLKDFSEGKLTPSLTLVAATDPIEAMKSGLYRHYIDFKQLFHYSDGLMRSRKSDENRSLVLEALGNNYKSIVESKLPLYERGLMQLLRDYFHGTPLLKTVSEELIHSKDQETSRMAAVELASLDKKSDLIKKLVLETLKDPTYTLRIDAIYALRKIKDNDQDEFAIIMSIDDPDQEVSRVAKDIVQQFKLDEQHVPSLIKVASSSNWKSRKDAAEILGRIRTLSAKNQLVKMLSDSDSDVAAAAFAQMKSKNLADDDLPSLNTQLQSTNWAVRKNAVELLGGINGERASASLIPILADPDAEVSALAETKLKYRALSDKNIPAFLTLLKNNSWEVRMKGVNGLNRIGTDAATLALISDLDDQDADVAAKIESDLNVRSIREAHVKALIPYMNSNSWVVRKKTATLLGLSSDSKALDILVDKIATEQDSDVRTEMGKAIKDIKGRLGK